MKSSKHPTQKVGRKPKIHAPKNKFSPAGVKYYFSRLGNNARLAVVLAVILSAVGIVSFSATRNNTSELATDTQNRQESSDITSTESIKASVTLREGTLQTKDSEGKWSDADTGLDITPQTALRTVGATSRSEVTFEDGSVVRLDANSELEFDDLAPQRVHVKHTAGYLYHRVISNPDRTYIVTTTDAQYEALGTAFRTANTGDEQSVDVFESEVIETTINKRPQEGEKLIVKSKPMPSKNDTIEKLDIEIIKNEQFISWNRSLDEKNDLFKNKLGFLSDIAAPEITLSKPVENTTIFLDPSATEATLQFVGTTEKNVKINIQSKTQPETPAITLTASSSGSFESPVITTPIGNSVFELSAQDRTGNKTVKTVRVTFQKKSAPVGSTDSITLSIDDDGSDIFLEWFYGGTITADDGAQLVFGRSSSPTYEDDTSIATNNRTYTMDIASLQSGKTYYFRVCEYNASNDSCSNYSNQVTIDVP